MTNLGPTPEPDTKPCCRVCGSTATARWKAGNLRRRLVPDDLRITDARYGTTLGLWRCAECGFIQADETEPAELTALYEQLCDPEYQHGHAARTLQMRYCWRKDWKQTLLHRHFSTSVLVRACWWPKETPEG
jgi:hypothetical protein